MIRGLMMLSYSGDDGIDGIPATKLNRDPASVYFVAGRSMSIYA